MDPKTLLDRLCARHGVSPERGARLLPLVRWALKGPQDSRGRILAVVERSLASDEDSSQECRVELNAAADHAVLLAVARVLHDWTPADSVLGLDLGLAGAPEEPEGDLEA